MDLEKLKRNLEKLKDEWDRLSLWSTDEKRMDRIEIEINNLEMVIDREEKLKSLGL